MVTCHALSVWVMPFRRRAAVFATGVARKTVSAGLVALAGAAVLGVAGVGPAGCGLSWVASANAAMFVPDPVFAGTLTNQQQTEMMQWGQAYWNKIEGVIPNGSNALAGPWSFSTPVMNSPLFNPFYGPRQTLVNLGLIADTDCMKAITETPGTDAATLAKRGAIKDALVGFKFKTDPVTDPNGTTAHVYKILDASLVSGLVTYTEGGKLVSEKLPLDIIIAAGAEPQFVDTISVDTINAINAIVVAAPGYAQTPTGGTEAQKLLVGGVSHADSMQTKIRQLLADLGHPKIAVERFDMVFSVYGSLPILVVGFDDAKLIIDTINGNVHPPVVHQGVFSAAALLTPHGHVVGGGVVLRSAWGCLAAPGPFVPPVVHPTPPSLPSFIAPPVFPSVTPGNPTPWTCTMVALVGGGWSCSCFRTLTYLNPPPGPPSFPSIQTCTDPLGPCQVNSSGAPIGPSPGGSCNYTY